MDPKLDDNTTISSIQPSTTESSHEEKLLNINNNLDMSNTTQLKTEIEVEDTTIDTSTDTTITKADTTIATSQDSGDILQSIGYTEYTHRSDELVWYITMGEGEQIGPLSENYIKYLIFSNQLPLHTNGWRPGFALWTYLYSLPEIYPHFAAWQEKSINPESWFYRIGVNSQYNVHGNYTLSEMKQLYLQGVITKNTMTWKIGDNPKAWFEFGDQYEFADILKSTVLPTTTTTNPVSSTSNSLLPNKRNSTAMNLNQSQNQKNQNQTNNTTIDQTKQPIDFEKLDDINYTSDLLTPHSQVPSSFIESQRNLNAQEYKRRKKEFNQLHKGRNTAIYISDLPLDTNPEELASFARTVGLLQLGDDGLPRVKLYTYDDGSLKGDGLVYFLQVESVDLAISLLDESQYREGYTVHVSEANFSAATSQSQAHSQSQSQSQGTTSIASKSKNKNKSNQIDQAAQKQRKFYQLAQQQALSWDEGHSTNQSKGLKVLILRNTYTMELVDAYPEGAIAFYHNLEQYIYQKCCQICGSSGIHRVKVFQDNLYGPVLLRLKTPGAAQYCLETLQNQPIEFPPKKIGIENAEVAEIANREQLYFVVDYFSPTIAREITSGIADDEVKRQEQFGEWLDAEN